MHRLFYIKFYDSGGRMVVRQDYSGLQFADLAITESYIQYEKKMFETALDRKLKLNPHHKEVPEFTIKDLITAYCIVNDLEYSDIVGKGRKRNLVNIRMFITKTALNLGFVHGQLRPYFTDGISYHYEKSFNDLLDTDKDVLHHVWKINETKVMKRLGALYKEDGSGEKIKDHESKDN